MAEDKKTIIEGDNNEVENIGFSYNIVKSLIKSIHEKDIQVNRVLSLLEKRDEQLDKKDDQIAEIMRKIDKKDAHMDELITILKTKLK